ncbi:MAG TPA: hypothetical protein VHM20_02535 [Gammaproteobacteria bacterium]|nr:hypothetical protein [Gammaproteobacteria bacterium]
MIERQDINEVKPINIAKSSIEQLTHAVKDIDSCINILSNQLIPEKIKNISFHAIIVGLDIQAMKYLFEQNVFSQEKINYGIFWTIVFSTSLLSVHFLINTINTDMIKSVLTSALPTPISKKIKDTAKHFAIQTANEITSLQLEQFKNKKREFKNIISDKKSWHIFSTFNHSKHVVSNDIAHSIEEFLFPKKISFI